MIKAFGEFVAGDQVIIGVILFSILVVIQFVVITRGATRISEVAARFMLDGLPGRQMAIDADLHAGLIDQHEAHRRREDVYRQADFFGAMDGAGKFVRGDAVAGVVILLVNIAGGLYLGMVNYGMSAGEAVNVFTKLTIGDGLVSQVPAFLISLASGLIVTRSSSSTDLNRDVIEQLFTRPGVLGMAAVFVGLMALTPLPKLPLLALGGGLGTAAMLLGSRRQDETAEEAAIDSAPVGRPHASTAPPAGRTRMEELRAAVNPPLRGKPAHPAAKSDGADAAEGGSDRMEDLLFVDPLELEIGFRLIGLADPTRSGDLLGRLKTVRQRVAREMGLIVPQVRIHDEIGLAAERISGEDPGYSGRAGGRLCRSAAGRAAGRSGHSARRPRRGRSAHGPARRLDSRRRPRSRRAGGLPRPGRLGRRRGPLRRDRRQPRRRAADPRAGRAAPGACPIDRPDPGRRSRARPPSRRGAPARPAEPAAGARQHPRPGDDPRDAGRPRRPDQGHRRPDRAGTPEPRSPDHRDLSRARRAAPRRHAGPPPRGSTGRRGEPVRDSTRRGPGRGHGPEHHSRRRGRGRHARR